MEASKVLRYTDEKDKSFGLAGMAIGLMAWDAEDWLEGIDLDAVADGAMLMTSEYYLCTAPKVGAKAVWDQSFKRFQVSAAMAVSNVVCRETVQHGRRTLPGTVDSALRKVLSTEGEELCGLEKDEVSQIYTKSLAYCNRLFGHSGVCQLAEQLSTLLQENRTLEASRIWQVLAPLSRM